MAPCLDDGAIHREGVVARWKITSHFKSGDTLKVRRELETSQNNTTSPPESLSVGLAQAHYEEHVWSGAQQQQIQRFQTKGYRQTLFVTQQLML